MRVLHVVAETPLSFLQHLKDITYIEKKPLKCVFFFFGERDLVTDEIGGQILRREIVIISENFGVDSDRRVFGTAESGGFCYSRGYL